MMLLRPVPRLTLKRLLLHWLFHRINLSPSVLRGHLPLLLLIQDRPPVLIEAAFSAAHRPAVF